MALTFLAGPLVGRMLRRAGRLYPTPGAGVQPMATKTFTTPQRERRAITFVLDGDEYRFTPPKVAGVMLPMLGGNGDADEGTQLTMTQRTWQWLRDGLPHQVTDDAELDVDAQRQFATRADALAVHHPEAVESPQYDRIMARLGDASDPLDVPDVAAVVRWLVGQATGRPTT